MPRHADASGNRFNRRFPHTGFQDSAVRLPVPKRKSHRWVAASRREALPNINAPRAIFPCEYKVESRRLHGVIFAICGPADPTPCHVAFGHVAFAIHRPLQVRR
jgi:hypothetical protein